MANMNDPPKIRFDVRADKDVDIDVLHQFLDELGSLLRLVEEEGKARVVLRVSHENRRARIYETR